MATKREQAIAIYQEFLDQEDKMSHREFRKLVAGVMKERLNLKAAGTVADYFADAANMVHRREPKQYTYGKRERTTHTERVALEAESKIGPAYAEWKRSGGKTKGKGKVPNFKRPATRKWSDVAALLHNETNKVP